jgi:hypothetical protein
MAMRRGSTMTFGFVLILIGIQLNVVQSYQLTPRFSNFLSENGGPRSNEQASLNQPFDSPYYQASFENTSYTQPVAVSAPAPIKVISTPNWLCWPVLFLGAVVFLHGVSKHRD